jgi:hypothetical protein
LWAYGIRASEEFRLRDWEKVKDPVLKRLFTMGIFDWIDKDDRLNQATQAVRLSTAMSSRMLDRMMELEDKVRILLCGPVKVTKKDV